MKDMAKILNKAVTEAPFKTEGMVTVKDILNKTATELDSIAVKEQQISLDGTKPKEVKQLSKQRKLLERYFSKFAMYEAEYVRINLPEYYPLIEEAVAEREEKDLAKAKMKRGLDKEQAIQEVKQEAEIEKLGEGRIFGYARVSTKEQNLDRQIKALKEAGCNFIFEEKKSGKNTDRPEFKKLMETVKAGDIIIVSELTRLARSSADLQTIVAELDKKGVMFKSLKEAFMDTTTPQGRLVFGIMSNIAQFEREIMLERQQEGIAIAKESGTKFGKKLEENADTELAIQLFQEGKYTTVDIAKMCHISRTTLWRELKKRGLK